MEYTYITNIDETFIRFFVTGEVHHPDDSTKIRDLNFELYSRTGFHKFLVDARNAEHVYDSFDVTKPKSKANAFAMQVRPFKIAILFKEITEDEKKFESSVVEQEGFVFLRVFDDIDKAEEWLTNEE